MCSPGTSTLLSPANSPLMKAITHLGDSNPAGPAALFTVVCLIGAIGAALTRMIGLQIPDIGLLLTVSIVAGAAQYVSAGQGHQVKKMESVLWTVLGFSFVRLGTGGTILVLCIAHLVEWLRHRRSTTALLFHLASFILAAHISGRFIEAAQLNLPSTDFSQVWGILARMTIFALIRYALLLPYGKLADPAKGLRAAAIELAFAVFNLSAMSFGAAAAIIWTVNPLATLLILPALIGLSTAIDLPNLRQRAITDPKTRLFNPDYFISALEKELARSRRTGTPLTVVMADLDYLREVNNQYGHLAGDSVLVAVAKLLKASFREYDVVARFGGEEFIILMPGVSPVEVFGRIKSLRQRVAALEIPAPGLDEPLRITMSFGMAGAKSETISAEELIRNADTALYQSKQRGRNRLTMYSDQGFRGVVHRPKAIAPSQHRAASLANLLTQSYRILTDYLPKQSRGDRAP
jgi:diguanylate cyclase (GGDEF)-like protein